MITKVLKENSMTYYSYKFKNAGSQFEQSMMKYGEMLLIWYDVLNQNCLSP